MWRRGKGARVRPEEGGKVPSCFLAASNRQKVLCCWLGTDGGGGGGFSRGGVLWRRGKDFLEAEEEEGGS